MGRQHGAQGTRHRGLQRATGELRHQPGGGPSGPRPSHRPLPPAPGSPRRPRPTRKLPGTGCEAERRPGRGPADSGRKGCRERRACAGVGAARSPRPVVTWAALRRRHGCVCSGGRAALRGGAWLGGVAADCAFGGARRPRGRGPGGPAPTAEERTLPPLLRFRRRPARGFLLSGPLPAGRGAPSGPDLRAPAARLSPNSM